MGRKNKGARKMAAQRIPERSERRAAFFNAPKEARGDWTSWTMYKRRHEKGNRKTRRLAEHVARRELARFHAGRWVRDLAFAMRGFARRTGCVNDIALRGASIRGVRAARVFVDGVELEGVYSIDYARGG